MNEPQVKVEVIRATVYAECNYDQIVIECDTKEQAQQLAELLKNTTFTVNKP